MGVMGATMGSCTGTGLFASIVLLEEIVGGSGGGLGIGLGSRFIICVC